MEENIQQAVKEFQEFNQYLVEKYGVTFSVKLQPLITIVPVQINEPTPKPEKALPETENEEIGQKEEENKKEFDS